MRRSLNLLVFASTALVVVAFVVPLALTVRRQADQRARVDAERDVQAVAALVVQAVAAGEELSSEVVETRLGNLPVTVILPDQGAVGSVDPLAALVELAITGRQAQSTYTDRGWELAVPIITRTEPIVVYGLVSREELTAGVLRAWVMLGLLGAGLIAASLLLADRLGRTLVGTSRRLAAAAHSLGAGDQETRVEIEGPPELRAVSEAFNTLATRLRDLLAAEREAVADLSHRLRTPLTVLRLQAEQLPDEEERLRLLTQIDRLHQAVDELIREARRVPEGRAGRCDAAAVVRDRVEYWRLLAEEQGREMSVDLSDEPMPVGIDERELGPAIEALLENIFAHTPPGTGFGVSLGQDTDSVVLKVSDAGPGFPTGVDVAERGASGVGSTGLGLDIARRVAERTGGGLRLGTGPEGGAQVELRMRLAAG